MREASATLAAVPDIAARIAAIDWARVRTELDAFGCARTGPLLTRAACDALAGLYDHDNVFRARVVMARHGYGKGEYRYFAYPLPTTVSALRAGFYPLLAPIANDWGAKLGGESYPPTLDAFLDRCHGAGQSRPTPLMLKYGPGDYNRLHRDLYGRLAFPLQVVVLLSRPGEDFTGGELVLTEQRPRTQSRAEVVALEAGEAAIVAVNERPERGARGFRRVAMRHGVSRVRSGRRFTLGIIFHDAA